MATTRSKLEEFSERPKIKTYYSNVVEEVYIYFTTIICTVFFDRLYII